MKYSIRISFFTLLRVFLLGCILFHILPCQAQNSNNLYISAHPDSTICEGDVLTLTAHCDCDDGHNILNQSFNTHTYAFFYSWPHFDDKCDCEDSIYNNVSCVGYAPGGEDYELSSLYSNIFSSNFPTLHNIYPAGEAIKLGRDKQIFPADYKGRLTSVEKDLSHPFYITIKAKGWGDEPGKINIRVDNVYSQSIIVPGGGWQNHSHALGYITDTIYFPAATDHSIITIETDILDEANNNIGYRAFIKEVNIRPICPHSWNTGNPIDTNAVLVVSPDVDTSYSVTVFYSDVDSATASIHITVNHPHGTSDTITECGSYTWNGTEYTESGIYYFDHLDANGCTQVDTLVLTIIPIVTNSTMITVCEGESVTLSADCVSEDVPIFSEGFSSVNTGSDASGSGSNTKLQDNEVANFPDCDEDHIFRAGGRLRFGDVSSGGGGYITSIPMDLSQPFTVKLWVRGWNNANDNPWFFLKVDNDTVMRQSVPVSAWTASYVEYDYNSSTGATANSRITIGNTTLRQRFFLDSVAVVGRAECQYAWNTGESTASITVTPNTSTTYCVTVTPAGECPRIDTFHVVVNPRPVVTLDPCGGTCNSASLAVDCQQGALLPPATPCASGYEFAGWTNEPVNSAVTSSPSPLYLAGEYFLSSTNDTLYAVYRKCTYSDTVYRKVTASLSNWSGNYLIAYTDGNMIFDGSRATLDDIDNYQTVSITNNTIPATENLARSFTIAQTGSNYTIRSASGKYIGNTSDSNDLQEGSTPYTNNISYSSGNVNIIGSGGAYLRFNNNSDQKRFRYFKSSTYTAQKAIQLYKYENLTTCEYTSYPFYPSASLTESACNTYTWTSGNGQTYTESGTYYYEYNDPNGCPQVDTLYLTISHESLATVTFNPGHGRCSVNSITEGNCQSGITLPAATSCSENYVFAGWTTTAVETNTSTIPTPLYPAGTHFNPSQDTTLYAVYKKCTSSDTLFTLVTTSLEDWSGEYLIVSSIKDSCFDGALTSTTNPALTDLNNFKHVIVNGNDIMLIDNPNIRNSSFLIAPNGNFWSIRSQSGYYISEPASGSTGINISNDNYSSSANEISYNNSEQTVTITCNSYGFQSWNGRAFRYYSNPSHENVQLYRLELDEDCEYTTYPPADTLALDSTYKICHYTCVGNYAAFCEAISDDGVYDSYWHWTITDTTTNTVIFDTLLTHGGVYYHTYSLGGCTRVRTVTVIQPESDFEFTQLEICQEDLPYHWESTINSNDTLFLEDTESDLYFLEDYQNEPCPSETFLFLTINKPTGTSTSITVCNSYTWNWPDGGDTTITESGDYTHSHEDINGCTQVDTLHLNVLHENAATVTFVPGNGKCRVDSLREENCQSGIVLPAATSCSRNYVFAGWTNTPINEPVTVCPTPLYLAWAHFYPNQDTTLYAVYKNGNSEYTTYPPTDTVTLEGTYNICHYNCAGNYTEMCDLFYFYYPNGYFPYSLRWTITDTLTNTLLFDTILTHGDVYYHNLSFSGCTTVHTVTITQPEYDYEFTQLEICQEDLPYHWESTINNNDTLFLEDAESGMYFLENSQYGPCPSKSRLYLTINKPTDTSITITACDSYTWRGKTYYASGDYMDTLTDGNGCTQVDTLHLTIETIVATVSFDPGNGTCDVDELTETDCLSGITLPTATSCAPDYEFAGWSITPITSETQDIPVPLLLADSHYNPSDDITLYAVYQRCDTIDGPYIYQLVTSDTTDWTGEYLIANTEHQRIWNVITHSDSEDAIPVNIINHKIPFSSVPIYRFIIGNMGNGYYSIQNNNGYYIGKCSDNSRNCSNGNPVSNIIEYDNGNVNISVTTFPDCFITYRSDASIFGYYARNYSYYYPIQLYRLTEDEFVVTCSYTSYPFYPSASFTVDTCDSYTWHRTSAPDTTFTNSGIYLHSYTEGGCVYVDTLYLTITSSPELTIIATPDTVICAGDSVTLQVMREVPRHISPVAVGDILCSDNSFVKPADWSEANATGKVALGVVFYVDNTGEHGWAVNLQDDRSGITWSSVSTNPTLTNYSSSSNAIYNLDGYTNTQRIREAGNAATYPAAWAVELDNGWYLPAAGQLRLLYAELVTINASLGIVGTPFLMDSNFNRYWSSTENNNNSRAWIVDHTGSVQNDSKSSNCNIRSVRNF